MLEQTPHQPESTSEQPSNSAPLPDEKYLTVSQNETPLEPPPDHMAVAATENDSSPQESEPRIPQSKTEHEIETPIEKKTPESLPSFKEESNKFSDLSHDERNSLAEFKHLVHEALTYRIFAAGPLSENPKSPQEVSIWGVPLLKDDRTDVILLKFLRARDFKVKDSFAMFKNTIKWRRDFNAMILRKLCLCMEKVVFMHGRDKEGHPVCYNVYGEFQNKELYNRAFADEGDRMRFLRWRIQFLERSIRKLEFGAGGINTIFQVSDLKNSPEFRITTKQALQILQDNYPEFVAKQVFINVPWWYLAFYKMISPFLTQRTKSKFVFAGPTRTAETLFKYIVPEQVPTQYGGLSVDFCECCPEFTIDDPVTEITVKPATKQSVEIIINEKCTLIWELRVVGWEVSYCAEFVPKHGYTVLIQKTKKMAPNDELVVLDSFTVSDLGKILLTIDNPTSKKKKLLYRFKVVPFAS
ncbi:hypothetical protein ACS0TY_036992 [Phlomoides rotata]